MVGVREHVYRLNGLHFIFRIEQLQVARLRSRITADVYDAFGFGKQNDIHYILVHSGTGRVGDDDIGTAVLVDEVLCQHVFHISGKEQCIFNSVNLGIDLGVFNGFGHIFYADYLACVLGYEIGNGTRAGIKVINKLVTGQSGKVARYFVEVVGLFGVGLIERFGTYLEAQSLHFLEDVVFPLEGVYLEVGDGIVALIINNV